VTMTDLTAITWDSNGLVPAIIQDAALGDVRMLGYVNDESLRHTIETGFVHFYSRSRQALWKKGETSGNVLEVVDIHYDCDGDTLLIRVVPHGPTCHTGEETCFYQPSLFTTGPVPAGPAILGKIDAVIADRQENMPEGSYTTYLFTEGIDKIGKKIGEESAEVIIAAKNGDPAPLAGEAADLIYHLLVLLRASDVSLQDVWSVLESRHLPAHPAPGSSQTG
jgi:phosphoribosyl-AMP cyclohydrolase / phosphoribosyl-ATP pyrophosphohydrolase